MQTNNQQHKQFLQEFGALLTTHTCHEQVVSPHPALRHLAAHVRSARRHRGLTRAALAQKTGKSEAAIYALEHGLLPHAELDLRFLYRLALALGEEVETLLLLMGRPALVQALQTQGVRKPHHVASGLHTTSSKHRDNWLAFQQLPKLFVKGCQNLIDFQQEGRLLAWLKMGWRTNYALVAMSVCLLFMWVSTYSLSSHFGAQSNLQSYTMAPSQIAGPHMWGLQGRLPVSSTTAVIGARPYRTRAPLVKATVHAVDEDLATPVPLFVLPLPADVQLCHFHTMGKFALCRI